MQSSKSFARHFSLSALILLFLAFLNLTNAAPIERQSSNSALKVKKRDDTEYNYGNQITRAEYVAYLQANYPDTDKYIFYTGGADAQIPGFKAGNPGYLYYNDFFDAGTSAHYQNTFPSQQIQKPGGAAGEMVTAWRLDDSDAASQAMADVARGKVTVFGAAQWQSLFDTSVWATKEVPILHESLTNGNLQSINDMKYEATSLDQIVSTEDANGQYTYENGADDKTVNNSYGVTCRRDAVACGADARPAQGGGDAVYSDPATQVSHTGQTVDPSSDPNSDPGHTTTTTDPHTGGGERPPQVGGHLFKA